MARDADNSASARAPKIAVLIATRGRRELLQNRALDSIAKQVRAPDYLVVIEDTTDVRRPSTRRTVHRAQFPDTRFLLGRNVRTPGVSGAWNTGVSRLLAAGADPRMTYVAILDDDDAYDPKHLRRCIRKAARKKLHLVAASLLRHESHDKPPIVQKSPRVMSAADFLVRSQHLQGSNLFVRLSTLLEAGNFDEGQKSVTDRDVCIRISDLPKLRFYSLRTPSVHHHAEPERDRMSTPRSPTRCLGLIGFHQKWGSRMSAEQLKSSRGRARNFFGWVDPPPPYDTRFDAPPATSATPSSSGISRLIVASVVRASHAERAADWLRWVKRSAGARTVEAIWFARDGVGDAIDSLRADGVDCCSVESVEKPTAAQLAAHVAEIAAPKAGDAIWFARDDFAAGARFATKQGEAVYDYDLAASLAELRGAGVAAARGAITGDSLEAPEFACRVELHDAFHNLLWLGKCDPAAPLADRGAENAALRRDRKAWNVDASLLESDRIERPFWLTPTSPSETVRDVLHRLARELPSIANGRRLFRSFVLDRATTLAPAGTHALDHLLILDPGAVLKSDLAHLAASASPSGPPVHRAADDLAAAPLANRAAREIIAAALDASGGRFDRTFDRAWRERLVRLEMSFHRTRGIARSLFHRAGREGSPWAWWWSAEADAAALAAIREFARRMRERFSPKAAAALREAVRSLAAAK
jgi:Glycosyl transferase family 2